MRHHSRRVSPPAGSKARHVGYSFSHLHGLALAFIRPRAGICISFWVFTSVLVGSDAHIEPFRSFFPLLHQFQPNTSTACVVLFGFPE